MSGRMEMLDRKAKPYRFDFGSFGLFFVPLLAIFPLHNNDLWWHLASGRWMAAHGRVPDFDPFSFTHFAGRWVDNEWLAEVLFFGVWRVAGNTGLVVLRMALFTAIFLLIRAYLAAARRPSMMLPATASAIAISFGWWELRPSVFSVMGMLTLLAIMELARRSPSRRFRTEWVLPLLFLVWANVHPGFFFGLVTLIAMTAAAWLEPLAGRTPAFPEATGARRRLTLIALLSCAAPILNPYGMRVFTQPLSIAQNREYRRLLDEWSPPSPLFIVVAIAALGGFLWLRFNRVSLPSVAAIVGVVLISTSAVRFQEYFALVAVPAMLANLGDIRGHKGKSRSLWLGCLVAASLLLALRPFMDGTLPESGTYEMVRLLESRLEHRGRYMAVLVAGWAAASLLPIRRGTRTWSAAIHRRWRSGRFGSISSAGGLLAGAIFLGLWPLPADSVEPGRYPSTRCLAVVPANAHPFHPLSWGGWMIWKRNLATFIDGRSWGDPVFFEYVAARVPGGEAVLRRRRVDAALLAPGDPVFRALTRSGEWRAVCRDPVAVVLLPVPEDAAVSKRRSRPSL